MEGNTHNKVSKNILTSDTPKLPSNRGKPRRVLFPVRFQPPRAVKAYDAMTHQQLLQEEQLRREEAEKKAEQLSATIDEMRAQLEGLMAERSAEKARLAHMQKEKAQWEEERRHLEDKIQEEQASKTHAQEELCPSALVPGVGRGVGQQKVQRSVTSSSPPSEEVVGDGVEPALTLSSSGGGEEGGANVQSSAQQLISPTFLPRENQSAGNVIMRQAFRSIPLSVTMDQLQKYSADSRTQSVQSWIERVDEDAEIHAWSMEEKFIAAKRALEGTARR